jgi:uridine phosphorylase
MGSDKCQASGPSRAPILARADHEAESVFQPENLLREARRQKRLPDHPVPEICVLDPDGDLVTYLRSSGEARPSAGWACYHTDLDEFACEGHRVGIVGRAVGAPFAVLVAEQLFASGCRLLISVTSAGRLVPVGEPPYFVLIDRALRDEGTSYHYLPAAEFAAADTRLLERAAAGFDALTFPVHRGGSWTTDAPFRETATALALARARGLLCVEMEAAALYAFAAARGRNVVCLAHVTNSLGETEGDFEKGTHAGALDALRVVTAIVRAWLHEPEADGMKAGRLMEGSR